MFLSNSLIALQTKIGINGGPFTRACEVWDKPTVTKYIEVTLDIYCRKFKVNHFELMISTDTDSSVGRASD